MFKRAITVTLTIVGLMAVAGCAQPKDSGQPEIFRTPMAIAPPTITVQSTIKLDSPLQFTLECEDGDAPPCIMWDEDSFYLITSWAPWRSIKLSSCKNEDGSGSALPCVWDAKNNGNGRFSEYRYLVYLAK